MVKSQKPDLAFHKPDTAALNIDSTVLERLWHMIPDDARLENRVLSTSEFSGKTMSECAYLISNDNQECERSVAHAGKKLIHFLFPDTTFVRSMNDKGEFVKSTERHYDPKKTLTSHMANGGPVFDERMFNFYDLFSDKEQEVARFLQVFSSRLALSTSNEEILQEVKEFQRITHLPFEVLEYFYEKVKHRDIFQYLPPISELNSGNVDGDFCYNASRDFVDDVRSRRFGYGFKADGESLFSKIPEKILNGILVEGAEVALRRQKEKLEYRLKHLGMWPPMRYGMAFDPERVSSDDNVIDFFHELHTGIDFLMHMTPDYRIEGRYEFKKRLLVEEYKKLCRQVTMSPLIFTHYVHSYIYFCYLTHDREALKEIVSVYLDIFQQNRIIEKQEWNKVYQGADRNLFEEDVWDSKDLDLVKTLLFSWNAMKAIEKKEGESDDAVDSLVERIKSVVINDIIKDHVLKKLPSVFEAEHYNLDRFDYMVVLSPLLGVLGDPELDYCVLEAIAKQADKHPNKLLMAEMYASNILGRYFYLPNKPSKELSNHNTPINVLWDITRQSKTLTKEQLTYWQQRFIGLFKPITEKDAANPHGFKSVIEKTEERSKNRAEHNDNGHNNAGSYNERNHNEGNHNVNSCADDDADDSRRVYHIWGGAFLGDYVYYLENQRKYAQAHLERYDIASARRHFAAIDEKVDYFGIASKMLDDLAGSNKRPLSKTKILNLVKSCTLLMGLISGHRTMLSEWFSEKIYDNENLLSGEIINMKYNSKVQFSKYIEEKTKANEEMGEEIFEKIMEYGSRFYDEDILLAGGKYLLSRNEPLFPWLRDYWPNFSHCSVLRDNEDALCIDELAEEENLTADAVVDTVADVVIGAVAGVAIDVADEKEGKVLGGIAKIVSKLKDEAVAFIEKKEYASAHMIYRKINPKKGNQEFLKEVYSRNLQEVRKDDKNEGIIGLTFVDETGKETKITFHTESLAGFGSLGVAKHSIIVNSGGKSKKGRRVIVTKINDDEKITAIEHKIYNELRHTNLFNVAKPLAVNGREIVVEYSGQTLVEYAQKHMQELARNTNNDNNPIHDYNIDKGNNPNSDMNRYLGYLANAIFQKVNINKLLDRILSDEDKAYLEERRIKKVLNYFKGRYSQDEINEQYHAFRVMRAFGFDDEIFGAAYTRTIGKALNAIPKKYHSWLKDSYGANFAVDDNECNNGCNNGSEKTAEHEADNRNNKDNRVIVFDFNNITYDASQLDDSIFIHTYGLGLTEKGEEALLNECMQVMELEEHEFGDVTDQKCSYKRGFIPASVHRNLLLAGNIMRAVESGRAPQERLADVNHHIERSMHYITQFVKTLGSEYNVDKEEVCYIIKTVNAMCMTYFERVEHRKTHRESINREESAQGIVSGDNLNNLGNSRTSSVGNLESSLGFSE